MQPMSDFASDSGCGVAGDKDIQFRTDESMPRSAGHCSWVQYHHLHALGSL